MRRFSGLLVCIVGGFGVLNYYLPQLSSHKRAGAVGNSVPAYMRINKNKIKIKTTRSEKYRLVNES